jgi:putative ABC transport system ATP-binding protein
MINLKNLEKSYPVGAGRYYVLRRITLDIQEGDFLTIMGPSGAGKSTLLAILGMLDGEWDGEFYFLEKAVHKMKVKERAELNKQDIGFVFQQYHLLDSLTVAENLDIPLSYRDVKSSQRQALVADTLDRFGIVGKKDLYPSQLFKKLNNEGTTIVQVTHNENWAAYGHKIIKLRDGWMDKD